MREKKDEQEHHELIAEQSVRVISIMDRRPTGKEIHGITHPGLFLVRSKLLNPALDEKEGWIGADDPRMGPLSPIRKKDLSAEAQESLVEIVRESISMDEAVHLSFFNRAQPITLKMHSYQLLPGIGKSSAQQWVQKRGSMGWHDLQGVTDAIGQDAASLLAERYVQEMDDPMQSPRLIDLVVRAGV